MAFREQWREIFPDLFGAFLDVRTDPKKWKRGGGYSGLGAGAAVRPNGGPPWGDFRRAARTRSAG